jgi:hypothetical protein
MINDITITVEEYGRLLEASDKLDALMAAGVGNWEGYDDAMADFYPDEDEYGYEDGDESMDGDFDSGMTSAGFGTDEDYGG